MRYLLDTHVLIWALAYPARISPRGHEILSDPNSEYWFSQISLWEAVIKESKHPEALYLDTEVIAPVAIDAGFQKLVLKDRHIMAIKALGAPGEVQGHKDPFDRLLLAQAQSEGMVFLTHDALLSYYRNVNVAQV